MRYSSHQESLGTWIGRGFLLALGYMLFKFVAVGLGLVATTIWDSTEHASPGVRKFVRGSLIVVGVLAALIGLALLFDAL